MLTRTIYFPEGALGIINTPFSSVVVPIGSGAPVSAFTRTTVAKSRGSDVVLLKTVPVMLPSAYALPEIIRKAVAKEIDIFFLIFFYNFVFWVQNYAISNATHLQR